MGPKHGQELAKEKGGGGAGSSKQRKQPVRKPGEERPSCSSPEEL